MNLQQIKLKKDIVTRWNSTYDLLERMLRIKDTVIATITLVRADLGLSAVDWVIIEKTVSILKIFYKITEEISGI